MENRRSQGEIIPFVRMNKSRQSTYTGHIPFRLKGKLGAYRDLCPRSAPCEAPSYPACVRTYIGTYCRITAAWASRDNTCFDSQQSLPIIFPLAPGITNTNTRPFVIVSTKHNESSLRPSVAEDRRVEASAAENVNQNVILIRPSETWLTSVISNLTRPMLSPSAMAMYEASVGWPNVDAQVSRC